MVAGARARRGAVLVFGLLAWLAGCDGPARPVEDVIDDGVDSPCDLVTCGSWQACCVGASGLASCIDAEVDPLHCGGCGIRCAPEEVCSRGTCAAACGEGLTLCARSCVDITTSADHCGDCGEPCGADAICRSGLCEPCAEGELVCDRSCVDPLTDPLRCGASSCADDPSTRCAAGEVCDGSGRCATSCAEGFERCGEGCVDLMSSSLHCGACGASCALTERCEDGACVCRTGLTACADECVNPEVDPRHCGGCGLACAAGERCRDGECTPCGPAELECEGRCVDPRTDPAFCGAEHCEAQPCEAPADSCVAGRCRAPVGATVATGAGAACAVVEGAVVCWGDNRNAIVLPETSTEALPATARGLEARAVAIGEGHACALTVSGGVACWGRNHVGQAGAAAAELPRAEPGPVPLPLTARVVQVVAAAHYACALDDDSRIYCWGRSPDLLEGEPPHATPFDFGIAGTVALAAGRDHLCALTATGAVWCWGSNLRGQLGVDIPEPSSPSPLLAIAGGAVQLSAGDEHTCAVMADATARCWGLDSEGQAGTGTSVACGLQGAQRCVYRPAPVSGLDADVVQVEAASRVSCALRTDGTVACWGSNALGRAAQPESLPRVEAPALVEDLGDAPIVELAQSGPSAVLCARSADDVLWCWGDNSTGALGDPDLDLLTSPVPIRVVLP